MNFLELAEKRYSCRKFSDRPVEAEKIEKILHAAAIAPTAVNKQSFKIWAFRSEKAKQTLKSLCKYTFEAPCFLMLGTQPGGSWTRFPDQHNFSEVDGAIAATHMMLEIEEQGLATTWVGSFDAPKLKEALPQLAGYDLIALFPVGYAAEDAQPGPAHTVRKSVEALVEIL